MAEAGVVFSGAERRPRAAADVRRADDRAGFSLVGIDAAPVAEWAALAERSEADNVFFEPDFVLAAHRHLGRDVEVATVRDAGGRLIAAAPLTTSRLGRIAPALRLFGHDYAPLGAPLIDRDAVDVAATALVGGLAAGGRSLIVPDLPLDGRVAAALITAANGGGRPIAILNGSLRAILQRPVEAAGDPRLTLERRRRKEFQRQMKKLAESGAVTFTTAAEPAEVAASFEAFLVLEEKGWKGQAGTALLSRPGTAGFARDAVLALAARGQARVDALRVDGRPVAILVTFLAEATAYTWKIAYDEAFARFSPGAQLMLEAGRALFEVAGVERIDSCASAGHPMIDHLWRDRLRIGTLVIGPMGGSLLHAAGLAAARAEISARALLRRLKAKR
jgi:CelD/BcsL family acetyltransferase involved in cellulose biosynthesis